MDVMLPLSQAYTTDRASRASPSSNFDTVPGLFDLPFFEDEPPPFLQSANAHDSRLPDGFDNNGECLNSTDIDRLFSEQELNKQAQSDVMNGDVSQDTANKKRDASRPESNDTPTATPGDPTAPAEINDMRTAATGMNRSSFVPSNPQSGAESAGNIASASESSTASCEVLRPGQDVDRAAEPVENRSELATEAVNDGSSLQSVSPSMVRHSASVTTEDPPVLPEHPSRISDEEATPGVSGQASIEKSHTVPTREVSREASRREPEHCFTQLGHSDCSPRPTTPEVCEHVATDDTDPNELPESLPHSRALVRSSSISLGARSATCAPTTLAADGETSARHTTNESGNGRAIAGSKRKYAKKTLISKPFRQKQDAALQVAWVGTQSIWVCLRPLLQGAEDQDPALQPHTVALVTKFENLCRILLDKECVDDPALVLDTVSAWRTVQELLSLEHDPQNTATQFDHQLAAFHEQVDLQIDIGKCLDEEQDRRKKARHRRA